MLALSCICRMCLFCACICYFLSDCNHQKWVEIVNTVGDCDLSAVVTYCFCPWTTSAVTVVICSMAIVVTGNYKGFGLHRTQYALLGLRLHRRLCRTRPWLWPPPDWFTHAGAVAGNSSAKTNELSAVIPGLCDWFSFSLSVSHRCEWIGLRVCYPLVTDELTLRSSLFPLQQVKPIHFPCFRKGTVAAPASTTPPPNNAVDAILMTNSSPSST